jgi:hypothetical protein
VRKAQDLGLAKFKHISIDGSKLIANAAKKAGRSGAWKRVSRSSTGRGGHDFTLARKRYLDGGFFVAVLAACAETGRHYAS